ncbi:hypothetical protein [Curtobacterium sp. DN_7.5]|uniref:hypothetical protein n=1 Tax=Curtobacterium sp. DN_7.5 TaxID=3049047 RepID=UPI001F580170|nr:hypothetical protein [Curtobacterium sp. DN_7.5]
MVQEIAIRVRLREQERLGLGEYERLVGSVATVAALVAWLPAPDSRLVLRGRAAEPVRLETVSYGAVFEMLVVLDQRSAAVERAASAVAALIESVRHEHVEDDVAGVAGELDRLDRSAPRGRSVAERSLRSLLEGARADVLARRTSTRVRAAQALLRLAEDGAELVVERVEDALAPELEAEVVDVAADTGAAVVVGTASEEAEHEEASKKADKKDASKKADKKKAAKKAEKKKAGKKAEKKKADKAKGKSKDK